MMSDVDAELLQYLCSVQVFDHACGSLRCCMTDVACSVGSVEFVDAATVRGPQLSLGVVYPLLHARGVTLPALRCFSRQQLQALAKDCRLSPPQWAALFGSLASFSDFDSIDEPIVAARGNNTVAVVRDPRQELDVVCLQCQPIEYAKIARPSPPRGCQDHALAVLPRAPAPPPYTLRRNFRNDRAQVDVVMQAAVADEGFRIEFSTSTQLMLAAFRRRYQMQADDVLAWPTLLELLKKEQASSVQLNEAYSWWSQCAALTSSALLKKKKKKKGPRSPSVEYFLKMIQSGCPKSIRAVMCRYAPHGGWFAVKEEAMDAIARRPHSQQDEAFMKLFEMCPGHCVVHVDDLVRCWKREPALALPFLGYMVAAATPQLFFEPVRPASTKAKRQAVAPTTPPHRSLDVVTNSV